MYLKEIELKGFKSFAQGTTIELEPLINAIVGPNGSGKSNIVDALRWGLGDQSQKNLRVENSGDLIFTGNEFCKASSSAKVRLLFDDVKQASNSANCPIDCNTLEIEKIIYNTGKTEYYLNKEETRLKDVTETLASLQLGVKGFSIINQGSIENILRVTPEERTVMLEEILGLRQLEIKKESSERKLGASLINLDKVKSLENEILPHYRSLKKNVTRFEKQKELKLSLEIDEKDYYSIKYKEITKDDVLLKEKLKDAQDKLSVIEKGIKSEEEKLGFETSSEKDDKANKFAFLREEVNNKIRAKNEEKNKIIYELAKTEGNLDNCLSKLEELPKTVDPELSLADFSSVLMSVGNIRILIKEILGCDNILEIKNKLQGIEREIDRIVIKKGEKGKDNSNLKKEVEELKEKVNFNKNMITLIEEDLNSFYLELEKMQKEEEEHNRNIKNAFSLLEQQQHEKMIALNNLKVIELSEEKIKLNLDNLRTQITNSNIVWEDFLSYVGKFDKVFNTEEFNSLESKIFRARKVIQELGFVDDTVMEEYMSVSQRLDFLSREREDLEKAINDLKQVIKELAKQINGQFDHSIKEINKEFNRYLQVLFGGGKGSIEILEPKPIKKENEENAGEDTLAEKIINQEEENKSLGVDIKVKLPKSKLEGVESLSGGEKALVSIALLFAIVSQSKPPLLVLDEVDAALDEENARRFGEILKELSGKTQFIIITHNWLTMAASQIIYGITIGKEKCSQVLSLQLEESRDFAKN